MENGLNGKSLSATPLSSLIIGKLLFVFTKNNILNSPKNSYFTIALHISMWYNLQAKTHAAYLCVPASQMLHTELTVAAVK